jgi:predicted MFS family arabinose efflux permease
MTPSGVNAVAPDLRLLYAASFASTFDRFLTPPLLLAIGTSYGTSLSEAVNVATAYFALYGLCQPLWGAVSDRIGRVQLIRSALLGGGAVGVASAVSPELWLLVAGRAVTGALLGAVIPTSLVYLGDHVADTRRRQRALGDLVAANGAATAVATLGAGLIVTLTSWRLAFVLSGGLAIAAALAVGALAEAERPAARRPLVALRQVAGQPWAVAVIALALVEGGVIFGGTTYLAPTLQAAGESPAVAGLVVAVFGASTLAWTRLLKPAMQAVAAPTLILGGAAMAALGYTAASVLGGLIGILLAGWLVAGCYAFMHTSLQTWATATVGGLRATVVSLFAAALFVGGAVAAASLAPLADRGEYPQLFAIVALVAVPLGVAAALGRRMDDRSRSRALLA